MATISLCMIVKNEEQVLARCLDSVADLMDEIIIVDTGSTDRTKEVAARYTDQIYDFTWIGDFSAARNFSFSKATMEYIYAPDADEVLDAENRARFLDLKNCLVFHRRRGREILYGAAGRGSGSVKLRQHRRHARLLSVH